MFCEAYVDPERFDYMLGSDPLTDSIAYQRDYRLLELSNLRFNFDKGEIRVAYVNNGKFSEWIPYFKWGKNFDHVLFEEELHRDLLPYELVFETDYDRYEDNFEAARKIARMLQAHGVIPNIYYGGNKSVHIHWFFDMKNLTKVPEELQKEVVDKFKHKYLFIRKFNSFLFETVQQWLPDIKLDSQIVPGKHLIRCELSKNKLGYKTFIGYDYKDISSIPPIRNFENGLRPELGEIKFSSTLHDELLLREFLKWESKNKSKSRHSNVDLSEFVSKDLINSDIVKFFESQQFFDIGDGCKRALFALTGIYKRALPYDVALQKLLWWNDHIHKPFNRNEIEYRLRNENGLQVTEKYLRNLKEELLSTE